ncbi:MAG: hypothetical protein NT105_23725 [Verrucomicrobia bacterium]|nr:hypothetical protein [Verrucomicrobiota bacterium]
MQGKNQLTLLGAVEKLDLTKPLPTRLKLLHWGDNDTRFGNLKVNESTMALLPKNQLRAKRPRPHGDLQHQTVEGTQFYKGEPCHLSARRWTPEVVAGEGLFACSIEWNPIAEEYKADYPDVSAAVATAPDGTVTFVHSFALCRHGEVDGITLPLSAVLSAALAEPTNNTNTGDNVDHKKLLLIILGLPDTATDQEIQDAATKVADKLKVAPATAADRIAAVAPAAPATAADAVKPLSAEAITAAVSAGVKPVSDRLDGIEKQNLTNLAIRDGKLIALSADDFDLAGWKKYLGSLAAGQVPMEQRTPEKIKALASTGIVGAPGDQSSDVIANVCKQMNITREQYDAAGK